MKEVEYLLKKICKFRVVRIQRRGTKKNKRKRAQLNPLD